MSAQLSTDSGEFDVKASYFGKRLSEFSRYRLIGQRTHIAYGEFEGHNDELIEGFFEESDEASSSNDSTTTPSSTTQSTADGNITDVLESYTRISWPPVEEKPIKEEICE